MPRYETVVTIAAPAAVVWQVTHDVASWPQWSPTMDEVSCHEPGPIAVGSRVHVRQPRVRPATWVVDHVSAGRRFCWHTAGPGYRLVADHVVDSLPDPAGTEVRLSAAVTGPLSWPVWLVAGRLIRDYVDQEAAALKRRCEAGASRA